MNREEMRQYLQSQVDSGRIDPETGSVKPLIEAVPAAPAAPADEANVHLLRICISNAFPNAQQRSELLRIFDALTARAQLVASETGPADGVDRILNAVFAWRRECFNAKRSGPLFSNSLTFSPEAVSRLDAAIEAAANPSAQAATDPLRATTPEERREHWRQRCPKCGLSRTDDPGCQCKDGAELLQQIRTLGDEMRRAGPGVMISVPSLVRDEGRKFMRGEPSLFDLLPLGEVTAATSMLEGTTPTAQSKPQEGA